MCDIFNREGLNGFKMEETIYNIIKKQKLSLENLQKYLNNKKINLTKDDLLKTLNNLTKKHKIFRNIDERYETVKKEYIIADVEINSKGIKFIRDKNYKLIINDTNLHSALPYDTIVAEIINSKEANILGILNRNNSKFVCEVKEKDDKLYLFPFNGNNEFKILIPKENKNILKDYIVGDRVCIDIDDYAKKNNEFYANNISYIGHFNDVMNDEIAIAISKNFDIDFSEKAMEETNNIPTIVNENDKKNRTDLTNETIFTIDSISTKDMDDAISIKKLYNGNYLLGVHIADVSYYVKPNSELFKDALKRGTSVYLGNVVVPMIPSILSNGICSLNEGVDRLAKTVYMEIDHKGKVIHHKIENTVIRSKKKMSYEDLNKMFKGKEFDESYLPFIKDISIMRELSNILTNKQHKKGNLDFESTDLKIKKDENNIATEFIKRENDEAEKIIENFMIIANETIATHFFWKNTPFVYRIHEDPDEDKLENTIELIENLNLKLINVQNNYGQKAVQKILEEFKDTKEFSVISNLLLRSMTKAKYSTINSGHYGLALSNYCHFTSPIRRLPDLTVHILINFFLKNSNQKGKYIEDFVKELDEICLHSNFKERQANDAEKDYEKLEMAKWMSNHIDETFNGMILDIDKSNVYVRLDNHIDAVLDKMFLEDFDVDIQKKQLICKYSKQKIKLGTKLSFKVSSVDIGQKEIYLEMNKILKNNKNENIKKKELVKHD